MGIQLKNNASGTLATAISASDTGIVLTTGNGASFPALGAGDYFYATLESTGGTFEVIKVTARSGDSMTVVRAQEGSTANSFAAGSRIELRVTGAAVTDFLQSGTGAVIRNFRDKLRDTVSVKDFGAVGNGVVDDTVAIQASFDAFSNTAGTGVFANIYFPLGTYMVATELVPNGCNIIGESFDTIIKASAAIRSVIKMRGQQSRIENLTIDANNLATYGVYVGDDVNGFGTNSGLLSGCKVQYAKLDGVYFSNQGNHNNFVVDRSLIWFNGSSYITGSATTTAGNNVATISGAADLTTFVQPYYDYIHVTGEPLPLNIIAVTANTVTTNPPFVANNTGQDYSIKQGSGVCISSHGDNSEIKITNSVLNLNQLSGVDDHALYGAESFNNVIEGNGYFGRIIGRGGAAPHYVISPGDFRNYYEGHTFGDIRFENGKDPVFDISGETNLSLISFNTSVNGIAKGLKYIGNGENFDSNLYTNFNVSSFNAEWGATHQLTQGGGVGDVTVNLPVSASAFETSFRTLMLSKITLLIYAMNGQNVIVKSASNSINGVAGTTGVTISGDYKKIECSFNGTQWIVG